MGLPQAGIQVRLLSQNDVGMTCEASSQKLQMQFASSHQQYDPCVPSWLGAPCFAFLQRSLSSLAVSGEMSLCVIAAMALHLCRQLTWHHLMQDNGRDARRQGAGVLQ